MNGSRAIIVGTVLCSLILIVLTYYIVAYRNTKQTEVTEERFWAPEFTLPDAKGEMVSLGKIEADIKIINFWASWSPYSAAELKAFNRIQAEYGDLVSVVALSRDTYPNDGKTFLVQEGIENNITFVYDREDEYYKKIEGFAVPETLFLDNKGEILFHKHGPMTYEEIRNKIEEIKT